MKNHLKPHFIFTARAFRRHTERLFAALDAGKPTHLIAARRERLIRLYKSQIKIPAR
jgi:hypothetical protein